MSVANRESLVWQQIVEGNVPDFMRTLIPVTVTATIGGQSHTATYYVTPDYMCIGSNTDFFRMPMTPPLAQRVADLVGGTLPTRKMVNDIWTNATVKLAPHPYSPDYYDILSVDVFWQSNQYIESQRAGKTLGALVGGIKKDVVITSLLAANPGRVAIYGWHYLSGTPIQPLYLGHYYSHVDYSHGIRIVNQAITVDGSEKTVAGVLADSNYAALLSDEGAFTCSRYDIPGATPTPTPSPTGGTPGPTATPSPTPAPNLVTNGNFEGGFTDNVGNGWTAWQAPSSNPITFGRASINKYDGSYSQYWDRGDTALFDGGLYQRVAVTPYGQYHITAWMKRQSTFTGTLLAFGYDLTGGTNGVSSTVVYDDITGATDNVNAFYDEYVTATGPNITLFARGAHTGTSGGTNAYFYLDAVSMTLTKDAPTTSRNGWVLYK